jgi:ribosomal protein L11 methylase PrmA
MGDRVRFDEGDFREMTTGANVVLANLTGGLLERSARKLRELVAPDGFLVVSGFMDSESTAVVPTLERFLSLQTIAKEEEWLCATYSSCSSEGPSGRNS